MATFDDDELERYFRRIEERTERATQPPVRRRPPGWKVEAVSDGSLAGMSAGSCPTPQKSGFDDEDAAWLAISVLRAGRMRTPELDVYQCRCGLWHITRGSPG